jgi:hypothetical protein
VSLPASSLRKLAELGYAAWCRHQSHNQRAFQSLSDSEQRGWEENVVEVLRAAAADAAAKIPTAAE